MNKQWLTPCTVICFCLLTAIGCQPESRRAQELFEKKQQYPTITTHKGTLTHFIEDVRPEARSTISLSSRDDWTFLGGDEGSVCVKIRQEPLLRPGDDWYRFGNWEVRVDGRLVTEKDFTTTQEVIDLGVYLYDEQGDLLAAGAIESIICVHEAVTEPGLHVADFKVWTSTGEEATYSWAFEVVP
jgi:hypothetical protein